MELKKILVGIEGIKAKGSLDIKISNLDSDSRKIKENGLFVAIKGFDVDGNDYIKSAIENGAVAVMTTPDIDKKLLKEIADKVTIIVVPDTRLGLALASCNFYGNPSKKFKLVGITGTKGKTTTSFMTKAILEKQGYKVGLIGTIATYIGDKKLEDSDRTTPEEHPDMQDYFNSKLKLLKMCKVGFTNADDLMVAKVPKLLPECNITTYGIDNYCNLLAKDITITNSYVDFKVKLETRNERVKVCIPGRFSVYNALAAISIAKELKCSAENIKDALLEVRVPGRSELVNNSRDLTIMIDYAHSPESLENILSAVKSYTRGRVISVFGCGGDRDS